MPAPLTFTRIGEQENAVVMGTPGYGCQFPKDENRETEVSGFRFFSSGWCFCEKIIGETFAISNIIGTFVAIRTDIKV